MPGIERPHLNATETWGDLEKIATEHLKRPLAVIRPHVDTAGQRVANTVVIGVAFATKDGVRWVLEYRQPLGTHVTDPQASVGISAKRWALLSPPARRLAVEQKLMREYLPSVLGVLVYSNGELFKGHGLQTGNHKAPALAVLALGAINRVATQQKNGPVVGAVEQQIAKLGGSSVNILHQPHHQPHDRWLLQLMEYVMAGAGHLQLVNISESKTYAPGQFQALQLAAPPTYLVNHQVQLELGRETIQLPPGNADGSVTHPEIISPAVDANTPVHLMAAVTIGRLLADGGVPLSTPAAVDRAAERIEDDASLIESTHLQKYTNHLLEIPNQVVTSLPASTNKPAR